MRVLVYRYNSIVEPHIIDSLEQLELEVISADFSSWGNNSHIDEQINSISKMIKENVFIFVFSINFIPWLSNLCEIYTIPYVCWTVDNPILQLFDGAINNKCNRIFFFDKAQYETFGAPLGTNNAFYLPLAGNASRFMEVVNNASVSERKRFSSDVSFIGSLYSEKNPYSKIKNIPEHLAGYVEGVEQVQMQVYGYNFIEEVINENVLKDFMSLIPDLRIEDESFEEKRYKLAHFFIGMDIAYKQRVRYLNALAKKNDVNLYTISDTSELSRVNIKGRAQSFTEMPIIFANSKINLNFTIPPIMTGIPQRVFDIVSCGGFVLTNYQQELPELFEIGEEIEIFSSEEELLDKVDFYLRNESKRIEIARKGYDRLLKEHTFEHRFKTIVNCIVKTV